MCTNYRPSTRDLIRDHLGLEPPTFDYVAEAWPGYKAPVLLGDFEWRSAIFGLVPFFAKDMKTGRKMVNARAETVDSRPSYRGPWKRRQFALVPMDCFFEPNYESGKPVRWRIERQDRALFTVAAIWDRWWPPKEADFNPNSNADSDGNADSDTSTDSHTDANATAGSAAMPLHSFSMLTINADSHPVMGRFHAPGDEKRSLVVVPPERRLEWLSTDDPAGFMQLLPEMQFMASPAPLPRRKAPATPTPTPTPTPEDAS